VWFLRLLVHPPPASPAPVFDGVNVALQAGEHVLLQGESGCGKSTLLALAAGVRVAGPGQALLLGQDWHALPSVRRDRRRADHIGCIFQQFNLLPYLSVLDNVLLPCHFSTLRAQRAGASAAQRQTRAQALLDALQLAPALWTRSAAQLSVGQQQRVAAARAFLGAPELVLADEPTSALDEARRDQFMALLLAVCREAGSALLLVSHDSRLAVHCHRTLHWSALQREAA
jgi:putative ABC transport system ATP-binding protein